MAVGIESRSLIPDLDLDPSRLTKVELDVHLARGVLLVPMQDGIDNRFPHGQPDVEGVIGGESRHLGEILRYLVHHVHEPNLAGYDEPDGRRRHVCNCTYLTGATTRSPRTPGQRGSLPTRGGEVNVAAPPCVAGRRGVLTGRWANR